MAGLTISVSTAGIALLYLIFIHKLEYFINAKIIGTKIHAASWEVLLAMLVFESFFGLAGLIVAPIFYAYIKLELKKQARNDLKCKSFESSKTLLLKL